MLRHESRSCNYAEPVFLQQVLQLHQSVVIVAIPLYSHSDGGISMPFQMSQQHFPANTRNTPGIHRHGDKNWLSGGKRPLLRQGPAKQIPLQHLFLVA